MKEDSPKSIFKVEQQEVIEKLSARIDDGNQLKKDIQKEIDTSAEKGKYLSDGSVESFYDKFITWRDDSSFVLVEICQKKNVSDSFKRGSRIDERLWDRSFEEFRRGPAIERQLKKYDQEKKAGWVRAEIAFKEKFKRKLTKREINELSQISEDGMTIAHVITKVRINNPTKSADPIAVVKKALRDKKLRTIELNGETGILDFQIFPTREEIERSKWNALNKQKLNNLIGGIESGVEFLSTNIFHFTAYGVVGNLNSLIEDAFEIFTSSGYYELSIIEALLEEVSKRNIPSINKKELTSLEFKFKRSRSDKTKTEIKQKGKKLLEERNEAYRSAKNDVFSDPINIEFIRPTEAGILLIDFRKFIREIRRLIDRALEIFYLKSKPKTMVRRIYELERIDDELLGVLDNLKGGRRSATSDTAIKSVGEILSKVIDVLYRASKNLDRNDTKAEATIKKVMEKKEHKSSRLKEERDRNILLEFERMKKEDISPNIIKKKLCEKYFFDDLHTIEKIVSEQRNLRKSANESPNSGPQNITE